jgi:hypothetical protein
MIQSRGQFGFYGAVFVFLATIVLDFGFVAAELVIQCQRFVASGGLVGRGWSETSA